MKRDDLLVLREYSNDELMVLKQHHERMFSIFLTELYERTKGAGKQVKRRGRKPGPKKGVKRGPRKVKSTTVSQQ